MGCNYVSMIAQNGLLLGALNDPGYRPRRSQSSALIRLILGSGRAKIARPPVITKSDCQNLEYRRNCIRGGGHLTLSYPVKVIIEIV